MSCDGLLIEPLPEAATLDMLIPPPLPEEVQQLLKPYVDPLGPEPARRLLGVNAPACLSFRQGKLLSDHLLAMTPLVADALLERMEGQTTPKSKYPGGCRIRLDDIMFDHMPTLHAQLLRPEKSLSGLLWPLTHPRTVLKIPAEDLPAWEFDGATDFARLIGTETYVCDLRFQTILPETKPLPTLAELMLLPRSELRILLFEQALRHAPSGEMQMSEARRVIEAKHVDLLKARPGVMGVCDRTMFNAHRKASLRLHQKRSD
jgi:hypothetical protein